MLRLPGRLRRFLWRSMRAGAVFDALRNLPTTDCRALLRERPVLVLAPHPDDESLGCGGLLAACQEQGLAAYVAILTDGSGSHPHSREYPAARLTALRAEEARAALSAVGVSPDRIEFLGFRDGQMPARGQAFDSAAGRLADFVRSHGIRTICATWEHDPHHDHWATYRMGRRVARAADARLLRYPVWGWTIPPGAWLPAMRIVGNRLDITRYLPAKLRAIDCHRSQTTDLIRDDPSAFGLSREVLAIFERPFEVFLRDLNA